MAVERDLAHSRSDENFRKGACHAAQWLLETSQTLAREGHPPADIADRLGTLGAVLEAWRRQTGELPDGNPWDWSFKDLASVIEAMQAP